MSSACPDTRTLRRLGHDSLGCTRFEQVEAHVADCPSCQQKLEHLARVDPSRSGPPRSPDPATPTPIPEIPGFTIGAQLGRGGGGVVYEAVQDRIGRRVALKILNVSPALNRSDRQRWLREAQAIGRIRHPHVVRLHEAGEHAGWLYLVLDLVPGGSLKDRAQGPLAPRHAATLIETIALAVAAIHQQGLLHLDLKPSNILLDGPPGADWDALSPVLTDFGIALDASQAGADPGATVTQGPRGTPAFMAPEQVVGGRAAIGPAADLFALGGTLYALLTGRPPFQAATALETLDLLRARDPAPPRTLVPTIPRDLETICLRALQKDPGRRYGSALELAEDLRRWLDGFPIRARPTSMAEQTLRACRRHPVPAALGLALAGSILVGLSGLTALWRQAESQRARAEGALARALRSESAAEHAAGKLIALITSVVEAPQQQFNDRQDQAVPILLDLTAQLRSNPRLAASQAVPIARLQLRLAEQLRARDERGRIHQILDAAADLLRLSVAARPEAPEPALTLAEVCLTRGLLALEERQLTLAADLERQALAALDRHAREPDALPALLLLHSHWCQEAEVRAQEGDAEGSGRILAASARFFERLRRRAPGNPTHDLLALLTQQAPSPAGSTLPVVASALHRLARLRGDLPAPLIDRLGNLIAIELVEPTHRAANAARPDPQAVTAGLFAVLDQLDGLRSHPALRYAIVSQLSELGALQASAGRRSGQLDQTRWAIAWMAAIGEALIGNDPDDVSAHLMLSKAHEQRHKLAWQQNDRAGLEPTLRAALNAGTEVLTRRPEDERVRQHVTVLREKYVRLITREPEPLARVERSGAQAGP